MLFSSLTFLYVFLPIVLFAYYVTPKLYKNYLLFFASMVFFAWGGVSYSALLIFSILINYFLGRAIGFYLKKKLFLSIGIGINLLFLGVFKYASFVAESINQLVGVVGNSQLPVPEIVLPIGISFYTFQAISYLIDIYRNQAKVQMNIANLGLFISLFPQLIAGPIVRYHDIDLQINKRVHSAEKFSNGVLRFVLGWQKRF